jgi:hypothetical protein
VFVPKKLYVLQDRFMPQNVGHPFSPLSLSSLLNFYGHGNRMDCIAASLARCTNASSSQGCHVANGQSA